ITSSESEQVPVQSTPTVISEQPDQETSLQDNVLGSALKIVSSEPESPVHPLDFTLSTSSEEEFSSEHDNEIISPALYGTIKTLVDDAIDDACCKLEQTVPDQSTDQSLTSTYTVSDEYPEEVTPDINLINDLETKSVDDYDSISGLTNIVNDLVKVSNETSPESSISNENNQVIASPKSDFDEQIQTTELPNIADATTKTLNIQTSFPEQSDISQDTPLQRASAVKPTFVIGDLDQDIMDEEPPTFFVPDTPTNSEANFRTLYEQRHFVLNANEEP
ncbi:unnamed protein product, partial [Rotaria magnacalcarata]